MKSNQTRLYWCSDQNRIRHSRRRAGQTSRVEAVRIAARRAGDRAKGSMMVSDAFFPFRDGIDTAHEIGVTTVVQPGGSMRDQESIDAADEHGMAMIFTSQRLFLH